MDEKTQERVDAARQLVAQYDTALEVGMIGRVVSTLLAPASMSGTDALIVVRDDGAVFANFTPYLRAGYWEELTPTPGSTRERYRDAKTWLDTLSTEGESV